MKKVWYWIKFPFVTIYFIGVVVWNLPAMIREAAETEEDYDSHYSA